MLASGIDLLPNLLADGYTSQYILYIEDHILGYSQESFLKQPFLCACQNSNVALLPCSKIKYSLRKADAADSLAADLASLLHLVPACTTMMWWGCGHDGMLDWVFRDLLGNHTQTSPAH